MRRLLLLGIAALFPAAAQSLVDAAHLAAARAAFESSLPAPSLKCRFTAVAPALNFTLRFQTGFSVEFPFRQFHGPGHGLEVLLRVTPDRGEPVILTISNALPDVPNNRADGESQGTFVVGEGAYRVDALLQDDAHRVCKSTWRIEAKLEPVERSLQRSLPPGAVAELASKPDTSTGDRGPKMGRLTVLLHAASLVPGRAQLQPDDLVALSGSLGSLLEQLPARSVRVVIFSLDQRAVLYQKDDFAIGDLDAVDKTLSELQLAVVNYKTLQNAAKPLEMAADLLRSEMAKPVLPDTVIFLGPYSPTRSNVSTVPPETVPLGPVKLFYLQYRRLFLMRRPPPDGPAAGRGRGGRGRGVDLGFPALGPPQLPDPLAVLTKAIRGETLMVHTPHEFAATIGHILDRLGGS